MRSPRVLAIPLAMTTASFLVACGGGDSGDDGASVPSIKIDQTYLAHDDNQMIEINGTFPTPDAVLIEETPDIGIEVGSLDKGTFQLDLPDLDRPVTTQLTITIVVGDREVTQQVSLLVRNPAAAGLVAKAVASLDQSEQILFLEQDAALHSFFVDYAYLTGVITHSEKQAQLGNFTPELAASYAGVGVALASLKNTLQSYRAGQVGEATLNSELQNLDSSVRDHGNFVAQQLAGISSYTSILVAGTFDGDLKYDEELGLWSRYTTNEQYGHLHDGGFVVAQQYEPISSLLQTSVSQSLSCEVL